MMGSIAAGKQAGRTGVGIAAESSYLPKKWAHQQPAMGGGGLQGLLPLSAELSPTDGFGERQSRYYYLFPLATTSDSNG